jgi:hypothetical protein
VGLHKFELPMQIVAGAKTVAQTCDRRQDQLEHAVIAGGLAVLLRPRATLPGARQKRSGKIPVEQAAVNAAPIARSSIHGEVTAQSEVKPKQSESLRHCHGVPRCRSGSLNRAIKQDRATSHQRISSVALRCCKGQQ